MRVSLSGLAPGKEYAVSFFLGSGKPAYQSVSLVSGAHVDVKALQTSTGSRTEDTWKRGRQHGGRGYLYGGGMDRGGG